MENRRCIIIGSSPDTDIDVIRSYISNDDFIACADGGHIYAERLGIVPSLIVGDFDSSSRPGYRNTKIIALPVKKDDTDTVSVINECIKMGFDEFLLFGMTGGRFDHTLANLSVLYSLSKKGKAAYMIDKSSTTRVISVGKTVIEGKTGYGFGIFPFACEEAYLSLSGFEDELDNGKLTADHPVGVSNTIIKDKAEISVFSGTAVIVYYNLNP